MFLLATTGRDSHWGIQEGEVESGKKVIGFLNFASAGLSPFPYLSPWALPNFDNTHCLGQEQALGVCTAV